MLGDRFTLEYSPQFYDEISDAIRYITFKLRNPEGEWGILIYVLPERVE